jgi:hypothetical protein
VRAIWKIGTGNQTDNLNTIKCCFSIHIICARKFNSQGNSNFWREFSREVVKPGLANLVDGYYSYQEIDAKIDDPEFGVDFVCKPGYELVHWPEIKPFTLYFSYQPHTAIPTAGGNRLIRPPEWICYDSIYGGL